MQKLPCAIRTAGILILILDDISISPLSLFRFIRYTTTPCFAQLPLAVSLWNSFLLFSSLSLFKSQPSTPKIYYFFFLWLFKLFIQRLSINILGQTNILSLFSFTKVLFYYNTSNGPKKVSWCMTVFVLRNSFFFQFSILNIIFFFQKSRIIKKKFCTFNIFCFFFKYFFTKIHFDKNPNPQKIDLI